MALPYRVRVLQSLRQTHGWSDEIALETILIAAWANFLSTLSIGVGATPDFEPVPLSAAAPFDRFDPDSDRDGPYLKGPDLRADAFAPFAFLRARFGFIPNVFRVQSLRPDVIEAEVEAIRLVLLTEDHLTRLQKELILLVVSAANRNTYFVAVHSEIVSTLGIPPDHTDKIAMEHRRAGLVEADTLLLDFAAQACC